VTGALLPGGGALAVEWAQETGPRVRSEDTGLAQYLAITLDRHSPRYWSQRLTDSLSGPANPYPRTPAMGAGVESHVWRIEEIVELLG
jgi:hypothetical protein